MSAVQPPLPPARHGPGWPLLLLLGGGGIAVIVAWVALTAPFPGGGQDDTVNYVEAVVGGPSRINPLFAYQNDVDRDLAGLIFSGLTRLAADGRPLPDLAQSWETSADGKTTTFHLRPGVKWQTGAAFTSADVLFTYQLLADPNFPGDPEQAPLWQALSCAAPDELTVSCQAPNAFAPFPSYASIGIVPKYLLEGTTATNLLDDHFNRSPVGTGPYRLAQLDSRHAVLKANDSYYLGTPTLSEIDIQFYPDVSTAAADVVRHQAQGLLTDMSASEDDMQALASVDGLKAYPSNLSALTILYLNNSQPPLNDAAVRQAIAQAIDIDDIISNVIGGRALRADSPLVPGTWGFDPATERYQQDGGQAIDLLEKAGWVLSAGSPVRTRNSQALHISLLTDADPLRGAVTDQIAKQLREAGIDVEVNRQASSDLVRNFLIPRNYQAAVFGWDPGPDPDPYPAWHSSQATSTGRNLAGYASADADKLMEEARQTDDLEARKSLYGEFQRVFHQDVPSIPLYFPIYTYFVTDEMKNVKVGVLFHSSSRFLNVNAWKIEKSPDIGGQ